MYIMCYVKMASMGIVWVLFEFFGDHGDPFHSKMFYTEMIEGDGLSELITKEIVNFSNGSFIKGTSELLNIQKIDAGIPWFSALVIFWPLALIVIVGVTKDCITEYKRNEEWWRWFQTKLAVIP